MISKSQSDFDTSHYSGLDCRGPLVINSVACKNIYNDERSDTAVWTGADSTENGLERSGTALQNCDCHCHGG